MPPLPLHLEFFSILVLTFKLVRFWIPYGPPPSPPWSFSIGRNLSSSLSVFTSRLVDAAVSVFVLSLSSAFTLFQQLLFACFTIFYLQSAPHAHTHLSHLTNSYVLVFWFVTSSLPPKQEAALVMTGLGLTLAPFAFRATLICFNTIRGVCCP